MKLLTDYKIKTQNTYLSEVTLTTILRFGPSLLIIPCITSKDFDKLRKDRHAYKITRTSTLTDIHAKVVEDESTSIVTDEGRLL